MLRVLITTVESLEQAEKLSSEMLERKLAGCVSMIPLVSKYWWKGKIERSEEVMLVIKTHQATIGELIDFIEKRHPYEVPEIIVLPVEIVSEGYLRWIEDVTLRKTAESDR
ncbi:MAG: divalent-cation tolerance protein CutA [Candidatus Korarchaeum sp.]|nr:divalent-cation tolerance protein CutA [Candidatus Korarchaeum sp.]